MKKLLAIDPGPMTSGVVLIEYSEWPPRVLLANSEISTERLCDDLFSLASLLSEWVTSLDQVCIEQIEARGGAAVGQDTLDTMWWAGRLHQASCTRVPSSSIHRIWRGEVRQTICGVRNCTASQLRRALIDFYPRAGGGKTPQIGTKGKPGPLYGVTTHAWSALAVGVTHLLKEREKHGR